jgi:hypothetical protein
MERARFDAEIEIAQDLRALTIAQADIGKLDHRAIRSESLDWHHNSDLLAPWRRYRLVTENSAQKVVWRTLQMRRFEET